MRREVREVRILKASGKRVIGVEALTQCNTKYQRPYLAVLGPDGEMVWQEVVRLRYGKYVNVYYVVENLRPGDYIQCAGGNSVNKYPFRGRVVEVSAEKLVVEEIGLREWSNLVAERQQAAQSHQAPQPVTVTLSGQAAHHLAALREQLKKSNEEVVAEALAALARNLGVK